MNTAPPSPPFWIIPALLVAWALGWLSHAHYTAPAETPAAANTLPAPGMPGGEPADSPGAASPEPRIITASAAPPPTAANHRHALAAELAQRDLAGFIAFLDTLRETQDPRWEPYLFAFKQTLQHWANSGKADLVIAYSEAFLDRFYFDADVLQLQAQAYLASQQPLEAIRALYTLQTRAGDSVLASEVRAETHRLVEDQDRRLSARQQWQDLLALYDLLVVAEPGHGPFHLRQAEVLVALQEYERARLALAHVYDDPVLGERAKALHDQMARAAQGEVSIALQRHGEHFLLPARLDDRFPVTLMLDTGASLSALSRADFRELQRHTDATRQGTLTVQTANGPAKGEVYRFRSLALGDVTVSPIDMVVLDQLPRGQGLLGMNVLGKFPFRIDQENSILLLNSE